MRNEIFKVISVTVAMLVFVMLTIFGCVSNQPSSTQAPKPGKPLVKKLPSAVHGAELADGAVRLRPGFQWVKQPSGTVTIARMGGGGGGLGVGGTWSCECRGNNGDCEAVISGNSIRCVSKTGPAGIFLCLTCQLVVTTNGLRNPIVMY